MAKAVFTRILVSLILPLLVLFMPGRVAPVAEQQAAPAAPAADFETLLNLNYCYGTSFSDEAIAMGTLLSLLDLSEEENGARYVDAAQADFFAQALYGRTVDFAACGIEETDGRVWIPAMGYDVYTHTLISAEAADGRVKVVSKIECEGHDGVWFDALCTSVFLENADSPFGYNLLSCEVLD